MIRFIPLKGFSWVVIAFLSLFSFSGCAAVLATQQPDKKDLSVLQQGTNRGRVISELGAPLSSGEQEDKRVDIYSFTQGYATETKAGRALFHIAADIFTLFIWELIATPTEIIMDGSDRSYKVTYDKKDSIEKVTVLKGKPLPYAYPEKSTPAAAQNQQVVQLPVQKDTSVSAPSISEKIASSIKPENLSDSTQETVTSPSGNVTTVTVPSQSQSVISSPKK